MPAVDPERELEALRTQVANQAASLAETVTDGFDGFHMGAGNWTVELMAPEGQSTAGGAHARQAVRLVPLRKGYAVVVAGTVDPVTSTAEVRTFEHVAALHEVRFRRPIELHADEYASFVAKLDVVFKLARVRPRSTPPPADLLAQRAALRRRAQLVTVLSYLAVGAIAALVVYFLLVAAR